jgi:hypothetical protein
MKSTIEAGSRYIVTLEYESRLGSNWIVHTYKRLLFLKRLISSDWFLNKEQAERFAHQLAEELKSDGSPSAVQERKPGWTLHRPHR